MNYFLEATHGMDRLGPGSVETTKMAIRCLNNKREFKRIIDVGCGNGGQTITLANEYIGASICGVDVDDFQIEQFKKRISNSKLDGRVQVVKSSMVRLPFQNHSIDLIWSEGAIYIMGFENGLRMWKRLLKKDGIIACTELTWLSEPSTENYNYWMEHYPQINNIENKVKIIKKCGYELINHFVIPQTDWTTNFYEPLEKNLKKLEKKYPNNGEVKKIIETLRYEMYLYLKYVNQYGYVFYIIKSNQL